MKSALIIFGGACFFVFAAWLALGNYGYGLDDAGMISHEFVGWINFILALATVGIMTILWLFCVCINACLRHCRHRNKST